MLNFMMPLPGEQKVLYCDVNFVDISAMHADFFAWNFGQPAKYTLERLLCLGVRASCRNGCKRTVIPVSFKLSSWTSASGLSRLGVMLEKHYKLKPKPKTTD